VKTPEVKCLFLNETNRKFNENYAYIYIFIIDNFNDQLYDQYLSQNVIRVIKSTKMRFAVHVVRMGKRRGAYRGLVGRHELKEPTWKTLASMGRQH